MAFELQQSIEVLEHTPQVLRSLLSGLSDFWSMSNYGEATFSPFDVVGHLLQADQTNWMPRLRVILEHGDAKAFPPFDRYAMFQSSQGKLIDQLLEAFAQSREENLEEMKHFNLTDKLDLMGSHPTFGPVTARQLIASWVVHDLGHLHQIAKAMAFQYREEVGPWREFLTILPKS